MQGLLLLNKPKGITSFSAVSIVKRTAHEKRVGHTGTLDPMATGVLPVLLGRATALSSLMLDGEKKYTAGVRLGISTDTDDITGNVTDERPVNVTKEELSEALSKFTGKIEQIPPMYSAIKKDGVRLYKLAREGKTAEIESRQVEIFSLGLLSELDGNNEFMINTHVSKGTYIRSLVRDIGEYLGCKATLVSLERTYASGFSLSDCISPDLFNEDSISDYILSEEKAVEYLPEIEVTDNQAVRFCNGGQLAYERVGITDAQNGAFFRVRNKGVFLGVGFADGQRQQIGIKCIINYPKGEQK